LLSERLRRHREQPAAAQKSVHAQAIEFTWNGAQWVREMSWK
jgi:hypothetical protein